MANTQVPFCIDLLKWNSANTFKSLLNTLYTFCFFQFTRNFKSSDFLKNKMTLRTLELWNLMPFFIVEIAKIKPVKYHLAKIAKLSMDPQNYVPIR